MFLKRLFKNFKRERRETLLEIIENQLQDNDPRGIIDVYNDLCSRGYSDMEVKEMFSAVFEGEIHKLNSGRLKEFDREFYLEALKAIK